MPSVLSNDFEYECANIERTKLVIVIYSSDKYSDNKKMAATLEGYLNRMVSIITADGRNFVGTLKGFDQTVNLILDDTHERVFSPNNGVEQVRDYFYLQSVVE